RLRTNRPTPEFAGSIVALPAYLGALGRSGLSDKLVNQAFLPCFEFSRRNFAAELANRRGKHFELPVVP
ncbi:MAG: hypothetical protein ACRD1O_06335, partial [Terriglobia bacterium]